MIMAGCKHLRVDCAGISAKVQHSWPDSSADSWAVLRTPRHSPGMLEGVLAWGISAAAFAHKRRTS